MPYLLALLALGPLVLAGWNYGLSPLIVYLAAKPQPARHRFSRLGPDDAPAADRARLEHIAREVQALGFELVDYLRAEPAGSVHALLVHRGAGTFAFASGMSGGWWVDFNTELEDGLRINTSNLDYVQMFRPHPRYHDVRLPGATSLAHLWLLHRKRVAQEGTPGAAAVLPPAGTEVEHVAGGSEVPLQLQAELGLYRRRGDAYVMTLKGAYAYVPRLMAPTGRMRTRYPADVAHKAIRLLDAKPTPPFTRPVITRARKGSAAA